METPVEQAECSICTQSEPGEILTVTGCGHSFHLKCLLKWNQQRATTGMNTTCPSCRYELMAPPAPHSPRLRMDDMPGPITFMETYIFGDPVTPFETLIGACKAGDIATLQSVLGSNPAVVNKVDADRMSALHYAVCGINLPCVEILLARGANPQLCNTTGRTALHFASLLGQAHMCSRLIAAGASTEIKDLTGETPIFNAVRLKQANLIRLLLRNRADINSLNNRHESAVHIAASVKNPNLPFLMSIREASPDMTQRNYMGETALHVAAVSGNTDFIYVFRDIIPFELRDKCNYFGLSPSLHIRIRGNARLRRLFEEWSSAQDSLSLAGSF